MRVCRSEPALSTYVNDTAIGLSCQNHTCWQGKPISDYDHRKRITDAQSVCRSEPALLTCVNDTAIGLSCHIHTCRQGNANIKHIQKEDVWQESHHVFAQYPYAYVLSDVAIGLSCRYSCDRQTSQRAWRPNNVPTAGKFEEKRAHKYSIVFYAYTKGVQNMRGHGHVLYR
jgi:hypothetical protein